MRDYFTDLHIHIGWTEKKAPVKITASKNLTFFNILHEAYHHKGLDIIGIIDAHAPIVQEEIFHYLDQGIIEELEDGGLKYFDLTIILGAEIEIKEKDKGPVHFLAFFPYLKDMVQFTTWLEKHMKNVNLSSQRLYVSARELQKEVKNRGGLFVPAHIFTPFKSLYGSCCSSVNEVLDSLAIDAMELGLSSDSDMADQISELHHFSFLTNSDAHSLPKIGREYNKLSLNDPTFKEIGMALKNAEGRKISANYGLDPKLGKYHHSKCLLCGRMVTGDYCSSCKTYKVVKGVSNRILELRSDNQKKLEHPSFRPPYIHQIPLEFIPGLGPKTLDKLLSHFGTEMNILHRVSKEEILTVIPEKLVDLIIKAREGDLILQKGGGGIYGKVLG